MSLIAQIPGEGVASLLTNVPFREIWAVDFEFQANDGARPSVVCMVAKELHSGRIVKMWRDELYGRRQAPFPTDTGVLVLAYYNSAEMGCFLELGWPVPEYQIDLYAEFRAKTNGGLTIAGTGLVGALLHHGLETRGADHKDEMRDLIITRDSMLWTRKEQRQIMDYCEGDVVALERLFPRMWPFIARHGRSSIAQALFRGRYMVAAACMEWEGIPIDTVLLDRLNEAWDAIKLRLIADTDAQYGIYRNGSFSLALFDQFLIRHNIPWPRTETHKPEVKQNTFRDMAASHPILNPLAELRSTLSELKLNKLAVGPDHNNRTLLSAFRARTGRNQPSNAKFVFGPAKWIRHLIVPKPGEALAYIDWRSQEIAIAAGLSGDEVLAQAYLGGDPYLEFAKSASLIPPNATKVTHGPERDVAKAIVLGLNYGMGARSLAYRASIDLADANSLIKIHKRTYRHFWEWSEMQIDAGMSGVEMLTRLGWPLKVRAADYNSRSLMNHPMQANGSDTMRLAACELTEAGHRIAAPVHDAFLLVGDAGTIVDEAHAAATIMEKCAERVAKIRVEAEVEPKAIVMSGQRFTEPRGRAMFARIMTMLEEVEDA